jgi:hypothetical protein
MKRRPYFFAVRRFTYGENQMPKQSKDETGSLVTLRRFFDAGEVYKMGVGLSLQRHSIQHSTCLLTHALSTTAQISVPANKKGRMQGDRCEDGKHGAKEVADGMAGLGKIAPRDVQARLPQHSQHRFRPAHIWQLTGNE